MTRLIKTAAFITALALPIAGISPAFAQSDNGVSAAWDDVQKANANLRNALIVTVQEKNLLQQQVATLQQQNTMLAQQCGDKCKVLTGTSGQNPPQAKAAPSPTAPSVQPPAHISQTVTPPGATETQPQEPTSKP